MLTPGQTETLRAVIDRLIPADDFPSGWDAGVGDYLIRQFSTDLAVQVGLYGKALDCIAEESLKRHERPFHQLNAEIQDDLLRLAEVGTLGPMLKTFFPRMVEHAMEGFYGDPGNGGNRDEVAWRMIGFEVRG